MRKRSKYRPRQQLVNPVEFVIESSQRLSEHSPSLVLDWKIKNTTAFGNLLRAEATKKDLDTLVAARNITEALMVVCGIKQDDGTLARSACALIEICDRYNQGKKALRAPEIQALRDLLPLHDELMDVVTVNQFEKALAYAKKEIRAGKAQQLKVIP
jgi:predicted nucleotidyltransferase